MFNYSILMLRLLCVVDYGGNRKIGMFTLGGG